MKRASIGRRWRLVLAVVLLPCATAFADEGDSQWLPAGDARLRSDIALLVDEGVIRMATSSWPIHAADLAWAMRRVNPQNIHAPALLAALDRVSMRLPREQRTLRLTEATLSGGRAPLLRGYEELARDAVEASVEGRFVSGRWAANVKATVVASPDDGQALRLDGSDLSFRLGNWNLSLNALPRWWGPAEDSSLILSTNARPLPQLALDRVVSSPSSVPILRWAGPWRFSTFLGLMEGERPDVDSPLLMGMRLSFKPLQVLELGLSRSAQFCGEGRPCDLKTFGRVLLGKDNKGIRVDASEEPGNQMAGFDARLTSPVEAWPCGDLRAAHRRGQLEHGDPRKISGPLRYRRLVDAQQRRRRRTELEYSDTACSFQRAQPYVDCGYIQGIFFAGYRYRGRSIGHTSDSDSEMLAWGLRLIRAGGDTWSMKLRTGKLDRFGIPDPFNGVTVGPADFRSAEFGWRGRVLGLDTSATVGVESADRAASGTTTRAFGQVQLRVPLTSLRVPEIL